MDLVESRGVNHSIRTTKRLLYSREIDKVGHDRPEGFSQAFSVHI
jgi:hypothetical protein